MSSLKVILQDAWNKCVVMHIGDHARGICIKDCLDTSEVLRSMVTVGFLLAVNAVLFEFCRSQVLLHVSTHAS